jgi:hypothetical protein
LQTDESGLPVIACDLSDPKHELYSFLHDGLTERLRVVRLMDHYGLRPVPATALHVTACDHVNPLNIEELAPEARERYKEFLQAMPGSLFHQPPGLLPPNEFFPAGTKANPIRFGYNRLEILARELALVALVEPSDSASREVFRQISERRHALELQEADRIGKPLEPVWAPHVTLAYFTSEGRAENARAELAAWDEAMRRGAAPGCIEFTNIHLYAFTDMTRFLRVG